MDSDQCAGSFGRLFGHSFQALVIYRKPPATDDLLSVLNADDWAHWDAYDIERIAESITETTSTVLCRRCGKAQSK